MINILTYWKPITGILVIVGTFYAGFHYRDLAATVETQQTIIKQQQAISNYKDSLDTYVAYAEKQTYENQQKHNKELSYYRNLVNNNGGLHYNTTTNSTNPSTGGNQTTTSSYTLPAEITESLLQLANDADAVVDQYNVCRDYVFNLNKGK